jgi:pimeloyl-ACP methyl ester carboxylesterase
VIPLPAWLASGARVPVELASGRFEVFVRAEGAGRSLTLLHGFPTCSWDWAKVTPELARHARVLALDFLGFGDSDKPRGHSYSLLEQADLVEAVWAREAVARTLLVVHDYAVSVAQELLARDLEGRGRVALDAVVLLNGGVYPQLHRPRLVQRLLLSRAFGPLLGLLLSESGFRRRFLPIFAPARRPDDEELRQHWQAISRRGGRRVAHRVIRYLEDRVQQRERWSGALERSSVPRRFVWGQLDPVSGAHMAAYIRERVPGCPLRALPDVGHYPQLEAPEVVVAEVLAQGMTV